MKVPIVAAKKSQVDKLKPLARAEVMRGSLIGACVDCKEPLIYYSATTKPLLDSGSGELCCDACGEKRMRGKSFVIVSPPEMRQFKRGITETN